MTLHLIKLCVGADSIEDLARWVKSRPAKQDVRHLTRQMPKRAEDLLDGGSLYWVIKGQIAVRQRLLDLRPAVKNGEPHCALILDRALVPTQRRAHRPFQGWRYLSPKDAPRDLKSGTSALSDSLRAELAALGLVD